MVYIVGYRIECVLLIIFFIWIFFYLFCYFVWFDFDLVFYVWSVVVFIFNVCIYLIELFIGWRWKIILFDRFFGFLKFIFGVFFFCVKCIIISRYCWVFFLGVLFEGECGYSISCFFFFWYLLWFGIVLWCVNVIKLCVCGISFSCVW